MVMLACRASALALRAARPCSPFIRILYAWALGRPAESQSPPRPRVDRGAGVSYLVVLSPLGGLAGQRPDEDRGGCWSDPKWYFGRARSRHAELWAVLMFQAWRRKMPWSVAEEDRVAELRTSVGEGLGGGAARQTVLGLHGSR